MERWQPLHYVLSFADIAIPIGSTVTHNDGKAQTILTPQEINAAVDTTLMIARAMRDNRR